MQSLCWDVLFNSDEPVAVSSPTGSGKTLLFEIAILRLLSLRDLPRARRPVRAHPQGSFGAFGLPDKNSDGESEDRDVDSGDGALRASGAMGKVLYVAPMRALAAERLRDWGAKFGPCGLRVVLVTGDDVDIGDEEDGAGAADGGAGGAGGAAVGPPPRSSVAAIARRVRDADIVVTTPEKWDAVTRGGRHSSLATFSDRVELVCIDEVHTLAEDRGGVLEALVSRLRSSGPGLRTIAVSATLPNLRDIADWLGASPAGTFSFGDEYRPTRLSTYVIGFDGGGAHGTNSFLFERSLDSRVGDVIAQYSASKPTLVFCASRKSAQSTAETLARSSTWPSAPAGARAADATLRKCLAAGVGFHSAALAPADRTLVEEIFTAGSLRVLCSTTTLALGVNLPAHLVIIKSTTAWRGAGVGYAELSRASLLQMIGRAGRPSFDVEGVAVIMTSQGRVQQLKTLVDGAENVESSLLSTLVEHLCAEIVLGTFDSPEGAADYLASTYLTRRLSRPGPHRAKYGLADRATQLDVDAFLSSLLCKHLAALASQGCIALFRRESAIGGETWSPWSAASANELQAAPRGVVRIEPRGPGHVMSRHYLRFSTLSLFRTVARDTNVPDALATLCGASEIASSLVLRRDDKTPLRYVKERFGRIRSARGAAGTVSSAADKAFQLLQIAFGRLGPSLAMALGKAAPYTFKMETAHILQQLRRISRAWIVYCACADVRSANLPVALTLSRVILLESWESATAAQLLLQLPGVNDALLPLLVAGGVTLASLQANSSELSGSAGTSAESASHFARKPNAWGVALKSAARSLLPRLQLTVAQTGSEPGIAILSINVVSEDAADDGEARAEAPAVRRQLTIGEMLGGGKRDGRDRSGGGLVPSRPRFVVPGGGHWYSLVATSADDAGLLLNVGEVRGPSTYSIRVSRPERGPRISVSLLHCRALGFDGCVVVEPVYGVGAVPTPHAHAQTQAAAAPQSLAPATRPEARPPKASPADARAQKLPYLSESFAPSGFTDADFFPVVSKPVTRSVASWRHNSAKTLQAHVPTTSAPPQQTLMGDVVDDDNDSFSRAVAELDRENAAVAAASTILAPFVHAGALGTEDVASDLFSDLDFCIRDAEASRVPTLPEPPTRITASPPLPPVRPTKAADAAAPKGVKKAKTTEIETSTEVSTRLSLVSWNDVEDTNASGALRVLRPWEPAAHEVAVMPPPSKKVRMAKQPATKDTSSFFQQNEAPPPERLAPPPQPQHVRVASPSPSRSRKMDELESENTALRETIARMSRTAGGHGLPPPPPPQGPLISDSRVDSFPRYSRSALPTFSAVLPSPSPITTHTRGDAYSFFAAASAPRKESWQTSYQTTPLQHGASPFRATSLGADMGGAGAGAGAGAGGWQRAQTTRVLDFDAITFAASRPNTSRAPPTPGASSWPAKGRGVAPQSVDALADGFARYTAAPSAASWSTAGAGGYVPAPTPPPQQYARTALGPLSRVANEAFKRPREYDGFSEFL